MKIWYRKHNPSEYLASTANLKGDEKLALYVVMDMLHVAKGPVLLNTRTISAQMGADVRPRTANRAISGCIQKGKLFVMEFGSQLYLINPRALSEVIESLKGIIKIGGVAGPAKNLIDSEHLSGLGIDVDIYSDIKSDIISDIISDIKLDIKGDIVGDIVGDIMGRIISPVFNENNELGRSFLSNSNSNSYISFSNVEATTKKKSGEKDSKKEVDSSLESLLPPDLLDDGTDKLEDDANAPRNQNGHSGLREKDPDNSEKEIPHSAGIHDSLRPPIDP